MIDERPPVAIGKEHGPGPDRRVPPGLPFSEPGARDDELDECCGRMIAGGLFRDEYGSLGSARLSLTTDAATRIISSMGSLPVMQKEASFQSHRSSQGEPGERSSPS